MAKSFEFEIRVAMPADTQRRPNLFEVTSEQRYPIAVFNEVNALIAALITGGGLGRWCQLFKIADAYGSAARINNP